MAPDGSTWHQLLKEFGEKCAEISGGKVKMKVFAGGVAGNEGDMVRKMRIGQLQAAALTVVGLHDIEASPQAIATPGLIRDQAEWEHVFAKLSPIWEKRFEDKGFVPLMWGDTGWIYMFFTKEKRTVEQTKNTRVFAWAGDPASVEGWKLAGYQPVVISSTDILTSLSTGMIEGFATSPVMAFTARYYERAKFMPDVTYGHLPGGTVIARATWERIPADLRPKILQLAREYGRRVDAEVNKLQSDSLAQMQKAGLKVIKLSDAEKQAWWKNTEKSWAAIRGGVVSAEDFDMVLRLRDEYRASKGKK
jgi:TRAP-type C4-dicarboxylate transport system substrate-binding protein